MPPRELNRNNIRKQGVKNTGNQGLWSFLREDSKLIDKNATKTDDNMEDGFDTDIHN